MNYWVISYRGFRPWESDVFKSLLNSYGSTHARFTWASGDQMLSLASMAVLAPKLHYLKFCLNSCLLIWTGWSKMEPSLTNTRFQHSLHANSYLVKCEVQKSFVIALMVCRWMFDECSRLDPMESSFLVIGIRLLWLCLLLCEVLDYSEWLEDYMADVVRIDFHFPPTAAQAWVLISNVQQDHHSF
jgi:hypothetical protein